MPSVAEAVHRDPIWRDRADFIIAIDIDPGDTGIVTEQLWAKKLSNGHFELCCIPFFAYDLALGDVVAVSEDYLVQDVIEPSGRYVFRVHILESSLAIHDEILSDLTERDALVERSSPKMFAVDARDTTHAQEIADYLRDQESQHRLVYETGKTS
jgi:hypothetical protein